MKGTRINLCMYFRAALSEPVEKRHKEVVRNMKEIGPPLGWEKLDVPPLPDFGAETLAIYWVKYPIPGIRCHADYNYRSDGHRLDDRAAQDDRMFIDFSTANKALDYRDILRNHFPALVKAYRSYRAIVGFGHHGVDYCGGIEYKNNLYNRLRTDKSIDIDGRNNIFTLKPAMYWDALLCQRALGYDRDEVIRRLRGQVPEVMPLMDGVYTVFNDDANLSYEEFVAINDKFKPILGLV